MTNEQVPLFYGELSALAAKYDASGIVGIWFSATTDNYGFINGCEVGNIPLKFVCDGLTKKLREFCDQVYKGPTSFHVHSTAFKIKR